MKGPALCSRCGTNPAGRNELGHAIYCDPCIAEVHEEWRQAGERIKALTAVQEAELSRAQAWTWSRLIKVPGSTRRRRETVTVTRHPSGWVLNLGFTDLTTCQGIWAYSKAGDIDGYHAFHASRPPVWKAERTQGRDRYTGYYCDAHLPAEFRPAEVQS